MSRKDLFLRKNGKFFIQEDNENSLSDKLEACTHFVNQIHTKQFRAITTYCTPFTSKFYFI